MNWYQAEDKSKNVRQVVLCGSSDEVQEKTRFGQLMLTRKFESLLKTPISSGFFYLDSDPGPFFMARMDHVSKQLQGSPVKVALSFYRMPYGGLIGIYVHVDCPSVAQQMTHPIVLFELAYGLDESNAENKRMIEQAIARDSFHLCFADGKGEIAHQNESTFVSNGLHSQFDMIFPMPQECRDVLKNEWKALLNYHASLASHDYNSTIQQMWAENPQGGNPVLPHPDDARSESANKLQIRRTPLLMSIPHTTSSTADRKTTQRRISILAKIWSLIITKSCCNKFRSAVKDKNWDKIKTLIYKGFDVCAKDKHGATFLFWVAGASNWDIVRYCINTGVDVNLTNQNGESLLHVAALDGNFDIVKFLVDEGADLGVKTNTGDTVLQSAVDGANFEVMKLLVEKGANVKRGGRDGHSLLHWACGSKKVSEEERFMTIVYLIDKGAEIDGVLRSAIQHNDFTFVEFLVEKGVDINEKYHDNWTALHLAADFSGVRMVKYLVEKGAYINATDNSGWTPYDVARNDGKTHVMNYLKTAERLAFLMR